MDGVLEAAGRQQLFLPRDLAGVHAIDPLECPTLVSKFTHFHGSERTFNEAHRHSHANHTRQPPLREPSHKAICIGGADGQNYNRGGDFLLCASMMTSIEFRHDFLGRRQPV